MTAPLAREPERRDDLAAIERLLQESLPIELRRQLRGFYLDLTEPEKKAA